MILYRPGDGGWLFWVSVPGRTRRGQPLVKDLRAEGWAPTKPAAIATAEAIERAHRALEDMGAAA